MYEKDKGEGNSNNNGNKILRVIRSVPLTINLQMETKQDKNE